MKTEEQFWKKVEKTDHCWEWEGAIGSKGYGNLLWNGKHCTSHRVSFLLTFGRIPNGVCVLHRCDNRKCVRPDHLFLGSFSDNTRDMVKKKRGLVGIKNGSSKLNYSKVTEMRSLYADKRYTQNELAEMFNISNQHVSEIIRGIYWCGEGAKRRHRKIVGIVQETGGDIREKTVW